MSATNTIRKTVFDLLKSPDFDDSSRKLCLLPAAKVVNVLFSAICDSEDVVKWRAVSAMGAVVSGIADENMESARVVLRRLMWSLNDESGGIGWGAPEAMGEIMARHDGLAKEFSQILVSYIDPDPEGNFLKHEPLRRGALWGIGRLAQVRPELVKNAEQYLGDCLTSDDAYSRGYALWIAGSIKAKSLKENILSLTNQSEIVSIYIDGKFRTSTIGEFAAATLAVIEQRY